MVDVINVACGAYHVPRMVANTKSFLHLSSREDSSNTFSLATLSGRHRSAGKNTGEDRTREVSTHRRGPC